MSAFDIKAEPTTTERFVTIRKKIEKLADFFRSTGKAPAHLQLFAGDYRYLQTAFNSRLRREAKAKEKAENELRKSQRVKEKAKVPPDRVEGLFFDGIPLEPYSCSRPRKFEA